jgi:hypothetical protein
VTVGDNKLFTFRYQSSVCSSGGCPLSLPVLDKSLVWIEADQGDTAGGYTMDVDPPSAGTVSTTESCYCEELSGATVSLSTPTLDCPSNSMKFCTLLAEVQTEGVLGPARIRVLDGANRVVDSAPFAILQAQEIQEIVAIDGQQASPGPDGAYAVHVGDAIAIQSLVTAGGLAMVYTQHGLIPSYSNPVVVASRPCGGSTDIEDSTASGPGTASVTMTAAGAKISTRFDVTP